MASGHASEPLAPSLLAVAGMPVYPPHNGYALRVSNLLRQLTRHWRVTFAAPLGDSSPRAFAAMGVHRVVPMTEFGEWGAPITDPQRRAIHEMMNRIIREESPQVAVVWPYAEMALLENPNFPPTILDRLDCEVVTAWREFRYGRGGKRRLRALAEMAFWAARERRLVRGAAGVVVDGETDARVLRLVSGRKAVHTIPNGVEIQSATPDGEASEPTVVLSGNMSYPPNVTGALFFAHSVWPVVRAAVPNARFVLAGRQPSAEILNLTSVPGIEVTGEVPDMSEVLRRAWVTVAPVRTGTGTRQKILDAWAVGRPVVLSQIAASGLKLDSHAASLIASNSAEMAALIERLLENRQERHALGAAARALAEREYQWKKAGDTLTDLLRAVRSSASPAPPRSRR